MCGVPYNEDGWLLLQEVDIALDVDYSGYFHIEIDADLVRNACLEIFDQHV